MRAGALVVAFVWVGVVVACGGSSSSEAATSDSFAEQYCASFAPCCGQANRPTDGATCKAFVAAAASGKTYDAVKGSACLDQIKAASSKPDFCKELGSADAPACQDVYTSPPGNVAAGGACKEDKDCAASPEGKVDCVSTFTSGAETRICQVQITGKEGDSPCVGTRDGNTTSFSTSGTGTPAVPSRGFMCNVSDGLRCDSKTTKCTRISDVGGPCDGSRYACVKTAYCDPTQKCAARLSEGAACGTNGVSTSACAEGTYCDTTTKKCTKALPVGAACTKSDQCETDRCLNGKCDTSGGDSLSLVLLCGG